MAQPGIAGGSNASTGGNAGATVVARLTNEPPPAGPQQLDDIKDVQAHQLNKAGRESGPLARTSDDSVYGFAPRPHGLASPANSLGTESLVTPTTTPEPSGSPRGPLDQTGIEAGPPPLPSPVIQNTYDRYMATPPMVMPQYMTTYAGYYSQPVYVVHSGAGIPPSQAGFGLQPMHPMQAHAGHHYLPHPLEPVHHPVPYDFSVPPPNYTYVPMGPPPHAPPTMLAAHPPPFNLPAAAMYKISDRFVPLEGAPGLGVANMPGMHHEHMPLPSGEMLMEPVPCDQLNDGAQEVAGDLRQCNDEHDLQQQQFNLSGQEDPQVAEVTEIIEEIQIFERPKSYKANPEDGEITYVNDRIKAGTVTPSDDGCDRRSTKSWYDECTSREQRAADESNGAGGDAANSNSLPSPVLKQAGSIQHKSENHPNSASINEKPLESIRAMTPALATGAEYGGNVNNHHNHSRHNSHSESHYGPRESGEGYQHRRRDHRDSRDSTRERSGGRFDNHGRRSLTPDKRYNRNNPNYGGGGGQRDDRRYSNPEHGATHLRARRPRGSYEQAPSRESSAGRRDNNGNNNPNHNRQRYYASPKRDSHDHRYDNHGGRRYDTNVRRGGSGSYRQQPWRDDSLPAIPRGGGGMNINPANNINTNNCRKPPLPRQDTHPNMGPVVHTVNGAVYPIANGASALRDNPAFNVGTSQQPSQFSHESKKSRDRPDDDPSFLEFLGPSLLGIDDRLDVKGLMSRSQQQAVSMDNGTGNNVDFCRDHTNGNTVSSSKQDPGKQGRGGHSHLCQTRKEHE